MPASAEVRDVLINRVKSSFVNEDKTNLQQLKKAKGQISTSAVACQTGSCSAFTMQIGL